MIRLLIVGCGSIGARHARNAATLRAGEIGVVDVDAPRRASLADSVGGRAFDSLEAALDWRPDIAVICTPPTQHLAAARACAEAGCDLLIEKPLSASLEGVADLSAAIARHGVGAAVAYQLRFHPAIARLRALARGGTLGRLTVVRAEFGQYLPDWRPSRDYRDTYTANASQGGGILLDASHEIDYVQWIAGDISGVSARAERLSDLTLDVEDTAALLLRLASGAIGELHLDCVQRGYTRGCTLIGTDATARWNVASGLAITNARGEVFEERLIAESNAPYLAELEAFVSHRTAVEPFASVDDARRVLAVALAARQSSAERREISL
jgi:predicted dehydrogenase